MVQWERHTRKKTKGGAAVQGGRHCVRTLREREALSARTTPGKPVGVLWAGQRWLCHSQGSNDEQTFFRGMGEKDITAIEQNKCKRHERAWYTPEMGTSLISQTMRSGESTGARSLVTSFQKEPGFVLMVKRSQEAGRGVMIRSELQNDVVLAWVDRVDEKGQDYDGRTPHASLHHPHLISSPNSLWLLLTCTGLELGRMWESSPRSQETPGQGFFGSRTRKSQSHRCQDLNTFNCQDQSLMHQ